MPRLMIFIVASLLSCSPEAAKPPGDDGGAGDTTASLNVAPFTSGCEHHDDCVIRWSTWLCGCEPQYRCYNAAVLRSKLREFEEAAREADEECTAAPECGGHCSDSPGGGFAVCEDSVCVYQPNAECADDEDCLSQRQWDSLENVYCDQSAYSCAE